MALDITFTTKDPSPTLFLTEWPSFIKEQVKPLDIKVIKLTSKQRRLSKRKLKIAHRQGKLKSVTYTDCYPSSVGELSPADSDPTTIEIKINYDTSS